MMIYIYYHVLSIDDYKSKLQAFCEAAKEFGLVSVVQKINQPEYFMEVITATQSVGEQLKGLSELRVQMGINKMLLNNKIHVEVFETVVEVGEGPANKQ